MLRDSANYATVPYQNVMGLFMLNSCYYAMDGVSSPNISRDVALTVNSSVCTLLFRFKNV